MRIKNKDIAKALGISTTAVSLALNNRPGVSEETRKKVLQMIRDSANEYADEQDIALHENKIVVLSIHKRTGLIINEKPFFSELVEAVQQEAMQNGYLVALSHYMPGQNTQQYMAYLESLRPSGIIVMATELDVSDLHIYKKLGVPVVLLDAYFDLEDIDAVSLDDQISMYRAVDYAYQMGHRNIGYLRSETTIQNFIHHFDGYMKGLREYGLMGFNHPVIDLPCLMEEARNAMNSFLDNPPAGFVMPTVFIADLDYIAIGAMQALSEHGYRIPEDISMIGYDDIASAAFCDPPLTTTKVNQGSAGRLAMQRLMDLQANGPFDYHMTTFVSSVLVERQSVQKLESEEN